MKKKLITLLPLLILVAACSNGAQSSEEISSSESGSGTSIEITSDTTESVEDSSDSESSSSSSESSEDSSSESSDSYVNAQIQFEIDSSESTSQAMSAESLASYIKTTVYTIKSVETSSVYRAEGTTKALKVSSSKHSGNIDLTFNDTLVVRSVSLYVASYNEKDSSVYVGLNNNDETLKSTQIGSSNDIKKVTYSFDSVEMTTLNITSPSKNQFNLYGIDIDSGPVEPVYATSITLPESMTLTEGSQKTLSPAITPANCNQKSITWTSSDNEVATVTNGLVKALKVGTADITATIKTETDSLSATCALTVEEAPASTKTTLKESYEDYIENNAYALSSCPTTGNPKILIIPIWFTDSSTFISNKDNVRNDIETAYLGSESETGWHSVKSYYYQESEQRLNLEGTVSD